MIGIVDIAQEVAAMCVTYLSQNYSAFSVKYIDTLTVVVRM